MSYGSTIREPGHKYYIQSLSAFVSTHILNAGYRVYRL